MDAQVRTPALSVVIGARNAAGTLGACLDAVFADAGADVEVIVVDDFSTDETSGVASRYRVRLIALSEHRGVAAARNEGAGAARAPLLLFLDADVVLTPGGLDRARAAMEDPSLDAVIGSYDDDPPVRTVTSLFKNLAHHHFHQRSAGAVTTFWGACGAVRRDRFLAVGGFDEERFKLPSIEDVDFGCRLAARGGRIRLDPGLQVKHLKRWTLRSLITTDVVRRAIPWTLLWLERGDLPRNLNFDPTQRAAALLAASLAVLAPLALVSAQAGIGLAVAITAAVWLNRDLYDLFQRKGGWRLLVAGFLLQQLYYIYSLAGLAAGTAIHFWRQIAGPRKSAAERP